MYKFILVLTYNYYEMNTRLLKLALYQLIYLSDDSCMQIDCIIIITGCLMNIKVYNVL